MKTFLLITLAVAMFTLPAWAQTAQLVTTDGVAAKIAQRYIEAHGWCDRPVPPAKPGTIVVYYARDAQGICTAHVKVGY